jgi:DNA adenine methylase
MIADSTMSVMFDRARLTLRRTLAWRRTAAPATAPAPIVKWVGGKTKLLGELVGRSPHTYHRYFEPFLGGAAMFFRLGPAAAVLSDTNEDLIGTYRAVRDDVEGVIRALGKHRAKHCETYYYDVRDRWNDRRASMTPADRAACFIYLNKTCFNGLWRVNRRGSFNVPAGRYENPTILDPAGLRASSEALCSALLEVASFESVLDDAKSGDFVYFDPPYDPVSVTSNFTSYTADSFGPEDQAKLAATFRELSSRGCAVMLSNSDTPLVRKLYAGFHVDRVMCARAINSKADARGAVAEVIVTNDF